MSLLSPGYLSVMEIRNVSPQPPRRLTFTIQLIFIYVHHLNFWIIRVILHVWLKRSSLALGERLEDHALGGQIFGRLVLGVMLKAGN
jgi:hypothetical protein